MFNKLFFLILITLGHSSCDIKDWESSAEFKYIHVFSF